LFLSDAGKTQESSMNTIMTSGMLRRLAVATSKIQEKAAVAHEGQNGRSGASLAAIDAGKAYPAPPNRRSRETFGSQISQKAVTTRAWAPVSTARLAPENLPAIPPPAAGHPARKRQASASNDRAL
jgi:hypothetical protein